MRLIQYTGLKPTKTDNANFPPSGLVWPGPDTVLEVEDKYVPALLKFPSIWKDVTKQDALAVTDAGLGPNKTQEVPPEASSQTEFSHDKRIAIKQAIALLDVRNPSHFTKSGAPSVEAIERLLGYDISSAERDAAWCEIEEVPSRISP